VTESERAPRTGWRLLAAAAAALILFVVARTLFQPFYDTNDDPAMRLIAEGRLVPGGTPAATLLFVNPIVGALLVFAHRILPAAPWYDIVLFTGELLAIAVSAVVLLRRPDAAAVAATIALLAGLWLTALVRVQFTIVAGHLTAAGCLLIADLLLEAPRPPRAARLQAVIAAALVAFGALVRWHFAVMVFAIAIVLGLPFMAAPPRTARRAAFAPTLLAVVLAGFALVAVNLFESAYYRAAPGWGQFKEYALVKARLTEWSPKGPDAPTLTTVAGDVGWSSADIAMLQTWLSSNPDLFGLDRLKRATSLLQIRASPFSPAAALRDLRSAAPTSLDAAWSAAAPAAWLLGLICLLGGRWRRLLYAAYAVVIVAAAIVVVPLFFKTMPFRVLWPIVTLVAAFIALDAGRLPAPRAWIAVPVGVLACAASWPVLAALRADSRAHAEQSVLVAQDVMAVNRGPRRTYIVQGSAFPFETYFRPLRATPPAQRIDLLPIGSSSLTPIVQNYFRREGITDLMLTFCSDDRYRLVAPTCDLPLVEQFVAEHFQRRVRVSTDFRGQTFTSCRCATAAPPPR
jgi:hypothetical protein